MLSSGKGIVSLVSAIHTLGDEGMSGEIGDELVCLYDHIVIFWEELCREVCGERFKFVREGGGFWESAVMSYISEGDIFDISSPKKRICLDVYRCDEEDGEGIQTIYELSCWMRDECVCI